jgi:signal transduction histidine kinase
VLREPGTSAGPGTPEVVTARLAEADGLVERARAAGLAVRVRTDGTPGALPVGVDLAAYRIVQESLTNALKHGTGEAELTIAYRPAEVVLTVENPVRRGGAGLPGAGAGLIGMRERATLLAGRFTAGPRDGRWQVRAALPTGEGG